MKWMKWKAAVRWSGLRPLLFPTCADAVLLNRRPTLRRDRGVELNGLKKKFQQLHVSGESPTAKRRRLLFTNCTSFLSARWIDFAEGDGVSSPKARISSGKAGFFW